MKAGDQRGSPRKDCDLPIVYRTKKDQTSARMGNSNLTGIYFESDSALRPGMDVCIKMTQYRPGSGGPEGYRTYLAKVRWCKKMAQADPPHYGIGAQYVIKSLVDHDITAWDGKPVCALCDKRIPSGHIHETDDYVYVCPDCFSYLQSIPKGSLKESLTNFMIGNVL